MHSIGKVCDRCGKAVMNAKTNRAAFLAKRATAGLLRVKIFIKSIYHSRRHGRHPRYLRPRNLRHPLPQRPLSTGIHRGSYKFVLVGM